MSDISLTASMRSNLLSLQNTQSLLDQTQERLSTGKKVNSAIDNPSSYYTAQSLNNRAGDLSALLDSMGQAIQTIKATNEGIETITAFAEQAKAVANTAMDTADSEQIASSQKQFNELLRQIDQLAEDAGYKGVNLLEGDELTVTFNESRSSSLTILGEKADSASLGITEAVDWDKKSDTTTNAETALATAEAVDINNDAGVTAAKTAYDQEVQKRVDGNNPTSTELENEAPLKKAYEDALVAAQEKKDADVAIAQEALSAAKKADIKTNKTAITESITQIEDAINTLRSMASTFGNNYSIVQNRQDFTDSLINVLTEGADNLTLADMNEESANMLALQTRQQLAINSLSLASQASQAVLKLF